MTSTDATQAAKDAATKYWGMAVALLSAAVYYAWSAYSGNVPDEAKVTAVMTGAFGIGQWIVTRNRSDTANVINSETLLAAIGIKEKFDAMEAAQAKHHEQNTAKLQAIINRDGENDRLHAEHINVTDSLAAGVSALNEAVTTLAPTFAPPPIHQRQRKDAG